MEPRLPWFVPSALLHSLPVHFYLNECWWDRWLVDTERLPSKVLRPLQAHLAFYGTGRRAQTLRTLRPSLACVTLRAEFDGKPLHVLASLMHLRSFPLDDLVIRDGIWGFHDLLFNAIIRWRLLWVDLGCEPTDGEAVLSCFVAPQPPTCARSQCFPVLNVVADQSVKWTLSFSSFLVSVNVILAAFRKTSVHPHIPAELHMREAQMHPLGCWSFFPSRPGNVLHNTHAQTRSLKVHCTFNGSSFLFILFYFI